MGYKELTDGPDGPLLGLLPTAREDVLTLEVVESSAATLNISAAMVHWSLTADSTFEDGLNEGQVARLHVEDNGYYVTWPSNIAWVNDSVPVTAQGLGHAIDMWKLLDVLYAHYRGPVSAPAYYE